MTLVLPAQRGLELNLASPSVRVLAETRITDSELRKHISDSTYPSYTDNHYDGDYLIEYAGRSCYQSFHNPAGRSTNGYIGNIVDQKHFSVLEHANVTFDIQGVSRSFTHELVRHRHLGFSQLSQRYVDPKDAAFVVPPLFRSDPTLLGEWAKAVTRARGDYLQLLETTENRHPNLPKKQVREAVRALAPNCIETKIVVTGNLRAWRDVLEKRWNSHADAEIQEVSAMIWAELHGRHSTVFNDIAYT